MMLGAWWGGVGGCGSCTRREVFAFLRINIYLICSLTKTGGKKIEWAY